jgi:hypothetical protein
MPSYDEILSQVFQELNDPERQSATSEFQRQLCEVCLCILQSTTQAKKITSPVLFPAQVPVNLFQQVPIIDMYLGGDIEHALPLLMHPIALRDSSGRELKIGGWDSLKFYKRSLTDVQDSPRTCYLLETNLLGLRPGPTFDTELNLTYVPYIEIGNLNENFPLDNSYIPPYTILLRIFLLLRVSRWELAKEEFKDFMKGMV